MANKHSQKEKKIRPSFLKKATIQFLDALLGIAENFTLIIDRKELYKAACGSRGQNWSVQSFEKLFRKLKKRGYLEVEHLDGRKESVIFTNKAKLALLDKIADNVAAENNYHFVSFDIPERLRRNRDAFRRAIKNLGFCEIQKSLWVCNKPVGEFVELAASEYKVSDYVVYIISTNTNIKSHMDQILGKTDHLSSIDDK